MSETVQPGDRDMESEDTLDAQTVVKGPDWLRRLLAPAKRNGK